MLKKVLFILLGFISLFFALVGVILPLLPTFPFLLLSSFCFIKGSSEINNWFESTKIYKKHLKGFKLSNGMTLKSKLLILIPVHVILLTLFFTKPILPMQIAIVVLLIIKTLVFIKIKTIKGAVPNDGRKGF